MLKIIFLSRTTVRITHEISCTLNNTKAFDSNWRFNYSFTRLFIETILNTTQYKKTQNQKQFIPQVRVCAKRPAAQMSTTRHGCASKAPKRAFDLWKTSLFKGGNASGVSAVWRLVRLSNLAFVVEREKRGWLTCARAGVRGTCARRLGGAKRACAKLRYRVAFAGILCGLHFL